ncbi:HepT-like ribonuclease domain-containing protein [Methylobacterium nonmethylotrophicum]|uniref:REase AHJR-like domain-containing protein n=1 Tax=Methylobacterium nonmethylotrophicum TaxID=1141884 RepID=A0A4Z0NM77_9HYPH|nr:HepT-like ribonuclease domain-containing protein [Methylobacterium nonmethylotrophicum]TGD97103.1 hypothetical protein EU555_20255 [Methylobacterium nonmethylotrophicum]
MTPSLRSRDGEAERRFVETLRARYEQAGFSFQAEPDADQLPDFLEGYRPDAIARKPGENVAIDVRRGPGPSEPPLPAVRRLFEGHPDWRLHVAFMASDPLKAFPIPRADPAEIRVQEAEVRALHAAGHRRPAFVLAWALLEAALRATRDGADRAHSPGTVVQALAMNGLVDPETERDLRALVPLRNRIVHGDLAVDPSDHDIALVLAAVRAVLSEEAVHP